MDRQLSSMPDGSTKAVAITVNNSEKRCFGSKSTSKSSARRSLSCMLSSNGSYPYMDASVSEPPSEQNDSMAFSVDGTAWAMPATRQAVLSARTFGTPPFLPDMRWAFQLARSGSIPASATYRATQETQYLSKSLLRSKHPRSSSSESADFSGLFTLWLTLHQNRSALKL